MSAPKNDVVVELSALAAATSTHRLRYYFSKRVPPAEVDDLVQEVFLRMQIHGSLRIDHMDGYLFSIAASVLADRARRRAVRHGSAHTALEEIHHPTEDLTPERVLLDREALTLVVDAIVDLPPRTREVFVLHRFEEKSCSAIASQLGITVSGVEKHIMRALRHLHKRLTGD